MTESDLRHDIHALMELQRIAWRQLASPSLTLFDRREIRNRIRQSEAELRAYLEMRAERSRFHAQPVEELAREIELPKFRLLAG